MKYKKVTQKEKDDMISYSNLFGCYLNGKFAKVYGRLNTYATVAQIDGPLAVEWSWNAVNRILHNTGKFSTK